MTGFRWSSCCGLPTTTHRFGRRSTLFLGASTSKAPGQNVQAVISWCLRSLGMATGCREGGAPWISRSGCGACCSCGSASRLERGSVCTGPGAPGCASTGRTSLGAERSGLSVRCLMASGGFECRDVSRRRLGGFVKRERCCLPCRKGVFWLLAVTLVASGVVWTQCTRLGCYWGRVGGTPGMWGLRVVRTTLD